MIVRALARGPFQQRGAVLFISLIILVVITLIGVTAMQTTTLDTKIAGNNKNYRISFEAAEAALTEAQSRLGIPYDLNSKFPRPGTEPAKNFKVWKWDMKSDTPTDCNVDKNSTATDPWWFRWDCDCWEKNAYKYSATLYGLETTSSKPLYVIEHLGRFRPPDWKGYEDDLTIKDYYRITARGRTSTCHNNQADVFLQSIFAWRYRDN